MRLHVYFVLVFIIPLLGMAGETPRVEPPSWWTGMDEKRLQLMVHAEGIASCVPDLTYPGVRLTAVGKSSSRNYLFLDLYIEDTAEAGTFRIEFNRDEDTRYVYEYTLMERKAGSANRQGFGPDDVIYLLMPDRFSNGDAANDDMPGMLEKSDRNNPDGRHGGDLKGIHNHLDYIEEMGFTAIWVNPVLENNNPHYSYHGYAITNFYNVDPRFGTNDDYRRLVDACHGKGLKVIKDMVFNHCGGGHWWMEDLPDEDWIHRWPSFTRSNFRAPAISDPYAAAADRKKMQQGWFDTNMPDLNQENEFLANYLIQNSIWWVEYAGLDGIRMDTYPYAGQAFMARWQERMQSEYPALTILGETWLQKEAVTSYYAASENERFGYNSRLNCLTDFPLHYAVEKAFHEEETWTEGMARIYYVLAQDFLYDKPGNNVVFADNHDLTRYYTLMGQDLRKYRMGLAFLLTTRGIPMIYYGTEILMEGEESAGHGHIREDFPGGWEGDQVNAFNNTGLGDAQIAAKDFLRQLLKWRQGSQALSHGSLTHFIPEDGVYVYFRMHDRGNVMVVMNNNEQERRMPALERFDECLRGNRSAFDAMNESSIADIQTISIGPKSFRIFEFKKL